MRTHPGMCFSMCQAGNTCLHFLFVFIHASQTVCKVTCLIFVEIDEFDAPDTENMHCAKLPDAQDDVFRYRSNLTTVIYNLLLHELLFFVQNKPFEFFLSLPF